MASEHDMRFTQMAHTLDLLKEAYRAKDMHEAAYWLQLVQVIDKAMRNDSPVVIQMAAHGCCEHE